MLLVVVMPCGFHINYITTKYVQLHLSILVMDSLSFPVKSLQAAAAVPVSLCERDSFLSTNSLSFVNTISDDSL